jgi:hypothetical protein
MAPHMQQSLQATNLADILERVLDKGIVIAGDITISLVDIELLSIKVRLLIASVDKAKELGINWWEADPMLSTRARSLEEEKAVCRRTTGRDFESTRPHVNALRTWIANARH